MSNALEIAAVGMRMQQRALDAIANNVSNMNTPAFKRSDLRFSELVSAPAADLSAPQSARPDTDTVAGVTMRSRPDFDQPGKVEATGRAQDIAIEGAGFIELMGPAGRTLMWRGGSLRVLQDGLLATEGGFPLKAGITVPADATELRIDRDGTVFARLAKPQGDTEIGNIQLVRLTDPRRIERIAGGIYEVIDNGEVLEAPPGEDGLGYIVQAALENSNVDLNTEFVGLLISQRAYAANAQVVRAADEFYSIANNLRR